MTKHLRAAIYVRISRDRLADGLGVARQEKECRELAARHGWEVAEVYVDDDRSAYSGKSRPAYDRMMEDIDTGRRNALVAWHADRLHRSPLELEGFIAAVEARGVQIATVTSGDIDLTSASGRMTARIVGAVARHESEHKAERQRAKHLELAQSGRWSGGHYRAFGYTRGMKEVIPTEAALIKEAAERVLAGETLTGIVGDWNSRGLVTSDNMAWHLTALKRVLTSARIAGLRSYKGEVVGPAVWPGVIDRATWEAVQVRLSAYTPHKKHVSALLTGWLICARCGSHMVGSRHARREPAYRCPQHGPIGSKTCGRMDVLADPVDAMVSDAVIAVLDSPALAQAVAAKGSDNADLRAMAALAEVEQRMATLADMFAAGEIGRAEWLTARRALEAREQATRSTLAKADPKAVLERYRGSGTLAERWSELSTSRRRALIGLVVDKVVVTTGKPGHFDPNRVQIHWSGEVPFAVAAAS